MEADTSYLAGFVPWYSGTRAVQSFARLRKELVNQPWVNRITQAGFISKSVAVHKAVSSREASLEPLTAELAAKAPIDVKIVYRAQMAARNRKAKTEAPASSRPD